MDALTDILESIRMKGSVFSRASLDAPWGVSSGASERGVFHAVVRGTAWARLTDGGDPVALERGDLVLMPFGDHHFMTDAPDRLTRPIEELTTSDANGMGRLVVTGDGPHTSLICGSIEFDRQGAHPVFSMLPPMIHVRDPDGALAPAIESLIQLIAAEVDGHTPGSETVVARLTDVLIVYVLRAHIRQLPAAETGWLSALRDPQIGRALGQMHRHPEEAWTAEALARDVGLSRSAFFRRFRDAVGETPADYLTRWRVHLAGRMLREDRVSVAAAARSVGYQTEAAFSNAFVRVVGVRPGAFKRAA